LRHLRQSALIARNSKRTLLYRKFITSRVLAQVLAAPLQQSTLSEQHMPHQHTRSAEMPVAMNSGAATMDAITIFKITAASLLFIVAAVAGMLPLLVRRGKLTPRRQAAASTLTCAASGVLIASGLCHMLPESSEELVSRLLFIVIYMMPLQICTAISPSFYAIRRLSCDCKCQPLCSSVQPTRNIHCLHSDKRVCLRTHHVTLNASTTGGSVGQRSAVWTSAGRQWVHHAAVC
jgi:hypothetical protein